MDSFSDSACEVIFLFRAHRKGMFVVRVSYSSSVCLKDIPTHEKETQDILLTLLYLSRRKDAEMRTFSKDQKEFCSRMSINSRRTCATTTKAVPACEDLRSVWAC